MTSAKGTASPDTDRELAAVQLSVADKNALTEDTVKAVEGNVVGKKEYDHVELAGKKFRVREKIGAMAMLKWSAASELNTDDPRALGAIYAMIKSVIHKDDWHAFEEYALDNDFDGEELLDVISKALELVAGRPTVPSSPSSTGS